MASPPFHYSALPSPSSFRLITLHPGLPHSPLQITLFPTTHATSPSYRALSYTWGTPLNPKTCYIESRAIPMQQNLHSALLRLRSPCDPQILWVDSICIDQTNTPERNQQVRLMGRIYSEAEAVIVWLGRKSRTSDVAMKWIEDNSVGQPSSLGIPERLDLISSGTISRRQVERWKALKFLCRRTYWSRVWIVQEVVLARRIIVRCGDMEARWDGLANIFEGFKRLFIPKLARAAAAKVRVSLSARLHGLRKMHASVGGCTLAALMHTTRNSLCSDPRDKVYALLGLAADCQDRRGKLVVDYSKGMVDVYVGLWKFYVGNCEPSLVVKGSQALERMLSESNLGGTEENVLPEVDVDVVGTVAGKIVYVGQPWKDKESAKAWYEELNKLTMVQDENRLIPVERSYQRFCSALVQTTAADAELPGFRGESEQSEMNPRILRSVSTGDFSSGKGETKFEALSLPNSSFWEKVGDDDAEYKNYHIFIGNRGQFGIAPEGTVCGDEICQFQESDVSVIIRREGGLGNTARTCVGKALLTHTKGDLLRWSRMEGELFEHSRVESGRELSDASGKLGGGNVHLKMSSGTLRWLTRDPHIMTFS